MKYKIFLGTCLLLVIQLVSGQTNIFPVSGSVGIGTISPNSNAQLEVNDGSFGKIKVGYGTFVGSTSQAYTAKAVFGRNVYTSDIDNVRALFTNGIGSQYLLLDNNGISFNITNGAVNSGQILNNTVGTFTTIGLGIGTSSPVGAIDIRRDPTNSNSEIYFTGQSGADQNSNSLRLNFVGYAQKAGYAIQAVNTTNYGGKDLIFYSHNSSLHNDYTSYDEAVRFTYNGKVGIGTSTPQASLDVNGNIYSNGKLFLGTPDTNITVKIAPYTLAVDGSAIFTKAVVKLKTNWPDYVFEPGYKNPSADSLEQFIIRFGHLPEMPAAQEVNRNGIDLGENQILLLKKIEELTLIIIDQNKKIKSQDERIKALEKNVPKGK